MLVFIYSLWIYTIERWYVALWHTNMKLHPSTQWMICQCELNKKGNLLVTEPLTQFLIFMWLRNRDEYSIFMMYWVLVWQVNRRGKSDQGVEMLLIREHIEEKAHFSQIMDFLLLVMQRRLKWSLYFRNGKTKWFKTLFIMTCLRVKNQFLLQGESVNTTGVRSIRQQGKERIGQILSYVCILISLITEAAAIITKLFFKQSNDKGKKNKKH